MSKRMAPLGAALAVGLCLAARETRLYTAVYNYPGLTLEAMLLNVAVCALLFAAAFPLLRREGDRRSLVALFAALTLLQEVAVAAQSAQAAGLLPAEMSAMLGWCAPWGESYTIGLVVIAVAAARAFGERSMRVFVAGFAVSGFLQLACALLKWEVALALISLFPLAALACFALFAEALGKEVAEEAAGNGAAGAASTSATGPDEAAGAPATAGIADIPASAAAPATAGTGLELFGWRSSRSETGALLTSFFLMGALLISTHATRMGYQDGGAYSMAIQVLSGLGGITAAALLSVLHRHFAGMTRLALVYLLVLPALLVALYATSLFQNIAVLSLLVFFHRFVYGLVYYFLWLLCLAPRGTTRLSDRFVLSFFVLKMGWAVGVLFFMILPTLYGDGPWSALLIGFFFALGAVDAFLLIGMLRTAEKRAGASGPMGGDGIDAVAPATTDGVLGPSLTYEEACRRVIATYALTKREGEVLAYLGKGRTAAYIMKQMYISDGTTRTHIDHIYKKLGVHSQQALIDIIEQAGS